MNYIVFDLEFNQNISSLIDPLMKMSPYPFEIIQIGAVKLDENLDCIGTFDRLVKPSIYDEVLPFIEKLTGINSRMLSKQEKFPEAYRDFVDFTGTDAVFCVWGMSDMRELYRNASFHNLDMGLLTRKFINLQPYATRCAGMGSQPAKLQAVVEKLNIEISGDFHNALSDARYTSEIFRKIQSQDIEPAEYDPLYRKISVRRPARVIDTKSLIEQFEKMYQRNMTEEEKGIIILSYKMGKTGQFLKERDN